MRVTLRWLGVALAALVVVVLAVHAWYAATIWWWSSHPVIATSFMDHRADELRAKNAKAQPKYQWIDYERISPHLKRAIIAAEDAKFVDHEGFDWQGIQRALEKNERKGRIVAGGSTITQQLAKNLFLTPTRNWIRKGQETVITLMLEAMLSKRRIFEIYLNVIELGNGVFGAEAAARHYFNTSAATLTPVQAARLAAMAPNPRFYERNPGAPGLAKKIGVISARMASADVP